MSNLETVTELLKKNCFCHNSELKFTFECMPSSIRTPAIKDGCDCFHAKEDEIKQTLQQFKTFMETKAKFKVGDRVELNRTPIINATEAWGWMSSRHFLIKGAQATVREISYYCNEFRYQIVFDEDSWIDEKNVIHPRTSANKHTYNFREDSLDRVGSRPCEFLKKLWSDFYRIGD